MWLSPCRILRKWHAGNRKGNDGYIGFEICEDGLDDPEYFEQIYREAVELTAQYPRVMVIGGGSIYKQMLPYCDTAYVTKVHTTPNSDTYFPNLDEDPAWELKEVLLSGEENGIGYEMCLYKRK